jgi:hypothetical protein
VPRSLDDRWSLDFVSDQLASGRRFRILAIFDDCTRECLAAVADISLSGRPCGARTRFSDWQTQQAQDDRQRQWR